MAGSPEVRDKRMVQPTLIAIVGDAMIGMVTGGLNLAMIEAAYGRADA